jgi:hypothetical protein
MLGTLSATISVLLLAETLDLPRANETPMTTDLREWTLTSKFDFEYEATRSFEHGKIPRLWVFCDVDLDRI